MELVSSRTHCQSAIKLRQPSMASMATLATVASVCRLIKLDSALLEWFTDPETPNSILNA
jgi:hypothetical protein